MAIITVSRQIASLGDEVAALTARKLGYKFICRKDIEEKILKYGFPPEELKKFDGRKPGFFASLSRNMDQYMDFLRTAIYEFALDGNCVIVGRGASYILKDLPNLLSVRFMCDTESRIQRVMSEYVLDEKSAVKLIKDNDAHQAGYYKSFFEADLKKAQPFHMVLNSDLLDIETASEILSNAVSQFYAPEKESAAKEKLDEILIAQRIVNMILLDYEVPIHFLRADIKGKKIVLNGIADSSATVERALTICHLEAPDYEVTSSIKVVQDSRGR